MEVRIRDVERDEPSYADRRIKENSDSARIEAAKKNSQQNRAFGISTTVPIIDQKDDPAALVTTSAQDLSASRADGKNSTDLNLEIFQQAIQKYKDYERLIITEEEGGASIHSSDPSTGTLEENLTTLAVLRSVIEKEIAPPAALIVDQVMGKENLSSYDHSQLTPQKLREIFKGLRAFEDFEKSKQLTGVRNSPLSRSIFPEKKPISEKEEASSSDTEELDKQIAAARARAADATGSLLKQNALLKKVREEHLRISRLLEETLHDSRAVEEIFDRAQRELMKLKKEREEFIARKKVASASAMHENKEPSLIVPLETSLHDPLSDAAIFTAFEEELLLHEKRAKKEPWFVMERDPKRKLKPVLTPLLGEDDSFFSLQKQISENAHKEVPLSEHFSSLQPVRSSDNQSHLSESVSLVETEGEDNEKEISDVSSLKEAASEKENPSKKNSKISNKKKKKALKQKNNTDLAPLVTVAAHSVSHSTDETLGQSAALETDFISRVKKQIEEIKQTHIRRDYAQDYPIRYQSKAAALAQDLIAHPEHRSILGEQTIQYISQRKITDYSLRETDPPLINDFKQKIKKMLDDFYNSELINLSVDREMAKLEEEIKKQAAEQRRQEAIAELLKSDIAFSKNPHKKNKNNSSKKKK